MNNSPLISIGLPVYNGKNFLKYSIESILSQTLEDFEIIISDNASTDETSQICTEFAAKDQRIRYYRNEKNFGAAYNYNRTFHLSYGKYFKWVAHDDILAPTFLEKCIGVLEQKPSIVLSYSRTIIIDEQGKEIKKHSDNLHITSPSPHERYKKYHDTLHKGSREVFCAFGVIRSSVLKKTSLIGSYTGSDIILLGELLLHGGLNEIPEYLFYRRDHPQTSCNAYLDVKERVAWFDPEKKDKIYLNYWTWLREYFAAIQRAQLDWKERVLCQVQNLRWIRWFWRHLGSDVREAGKTLIRTYIGA